MLNEMLDLYTCSHLPSHTLPLGTKGAIIVIHGGHEQEHGHGPTVATEINRAVESLGWCIFINIGDEQSEFPNELLSHPNSRLWLQTPLPAQRADRYLVEGYLKGAKRDGVAKDTDWFFAGQNTHARRHECVHELRVMPGGILIETEGFGHGIPHADYIRWMNRARVVPCPSGPASPDSFRVWEALECGAVPIVDARSLRDETLGFWTTVLGEHPLTVVEDWETLPEVMAKILADYERVQRLTDYWWRKYKLGFRDWLLQDLVALGAV